MGVVADMTVPEGRLAVWHLVEGESELAALCSDAERACGAKFTSTKRRKEWFGGRALLRQISGGATVVYDAIGAPLLEDAGAYVSLSHTGDYAVAMLSGVRCGVDIESLERDFSKASPRYIGSREEAFRSGAEHFGAIVWSAKETAYKWCGREGLDFKRDIYITSFSGDGQAGSVDVNICGQELAVRWMLYDGHVIAYAAK